MKKTKIIVKSKQKMQNTESFILDYEEKLNKLLNDGYEIKSSNFTSENNFAYIYTLLEKDV